jgi:hypothetical protein
MTIAIPNTFRLVLPFLEITLDSTMATGATSGELLSTRLGSTLPAGSCFVLAARHIGLLYSLDRRWTKSMQHLGLSGREWGRNQDLMRK